MVHAVPVTDRILQRALGQIGGHGVEQLIEVPKLSTLTRISAHAFVQTQTAEQLVEVPVLSLDDCFLVLQGQKSWWKCRRSCLSSLVSFPLSSAQMVKQRVKVPKSLSHALKRRVEQIVDTLVPGSVRTRDLATSSTTLEEATSSRYGFFHFSQVQKSATATSQVTPATNPWTPAACQPMEFAVVEEMD